MERTTEYKMTRVALPAKLYLDDLQDIAAIVGSAYESTEIKAAGFKLSPEEIEELAAKCAENRFEQIDIYASPSFSLTITRASCLIHAKEEVKLDGVIRRVEDILKKRQAINWEKVSDTVLNVCVAGCVASAFLGDLYLAAASIGIAVIFLLFLNPPLEIKL